MKKMRRFTTLLLALITVLVMSQAAFALDSTMNGGTYTYNGSSISMTGTQSIQTALSGLEPGDSITITQTYTNGSDNNTEWYLRNDVIKSLENGSSAEDGGYTYILTSGGQVIFSSEQVGGTDAPASGSDKGLQLATDATDEWIHIDSLAAGASGTTTLYVALDGESQANIYQTTDAELELQYAVEDEAVGEDIIVTKTVKTGDDTNLMMPVVTFLGSLLLLILAVISFRKDRKDGEKA